MYADPEAEQAQAHWFEALLTHDQYIMLPCEQAGQINGFEIGKLLSAPEVYNPVGLTLEIDVFCVANDAHWETVGASLLQEIKQLALQRGAGQVMIVSGHHDEAKRNFLARQHLSLASEWYVGGIS